MRKSAVALAGLLFASVPLQPAGAWMHAGGWGAGGGHWGAVGGAGQGWHAGGVTGGGRTWGASGNAYGWHGSGSGGWHAAGDYHNWAAVGPNDHWATGSRYYGGGGSWAAVHPPAVVNHYYGGSGCGNCGGWNSGPSPAGAAAVGAVAGLAAGAAIGAAAARHYSMGAVYPVLPAGCAYSPYGGATYYSCNGAWFQPAYGANGTYYTVVPAP
jgi:hypothetical protein